MAHRYKPLKMTARQCRDAGGKEIQIAIETPGFLMPQRKEERLDLRFVVTNEDGYELWRSETTGVFYASKNGEWYRCLYATK